VSDTFNVHSSVRDYSVHIGTSLAEGVFARTGTLTIADEALIAHWPQLANERVIGVRAEEQRKTLDTVCRVIEQMRLLEAKRDSHVIAIGGGIVQDIATLAASLYMRGVTWTYLPTTLLGMVDSCIGGKSSINVGQFKNLAGNYYPPEQVVVDTRFCETLGTTQLVAGLCEAVKICYAQRGDAFERYLAITDAGELPDPAVLASIISLSLRTKKQFIEEDEFDQSVRLLLNFGHTFGHAIEGACHFRISHGVAVGLGMLVARDFARDMGFIGADIPRLEKLAQYLRRILACVPTLRADIAHIDASDALKKFKSDKKHKPDKYAVIGFDPGGYLERRVIEMNPAVDAALLRAFSKTGILIDEIQ
jgi:3-dehydroquinate synthase